MCLQIWDFKKSWKINRCIRSHFLPARSLKFQPNFGQFSAGFGQVILHWWLPDPASKKKKIIVAACTISSPFCGEFTHMLINACCQVAPCAERDHAAFHAVGCDWLLPWSPNQVQGKLLFSLSPYAPKLAETKWRCSLGAWDRSVQKSVALHGGNPPCMRSCFHRLSSRHFVNVTTRYMWVWLGSLSVAINLLKR